MKISVSDPKLETTESVSLYREAQGWVEADLRSGKCRLPAKEDFLLPDADTDGDDVSVEFESTLLPRAVYFQYAYRQHMHRERPDLLQCPENKDKAEQLLRRYGAVLALQGLQPDGCVPLAKADRTCCQYQAMMALISEGHRQECATTATPA